MSRVSVAEAANILGVSPRRVQARIDAGSLPAERVGSQWVIDAADLLAVKHHGRPGRPMSERSAWALVAVAGGDGPVLAKLAPPERSRARARLCELVRRVQVAELDEAAAELAHALGKRAKRVAFLASSRDLADVRADDRVRLSGLSAGRSNLSSGDLVEGYVSSADSKDLVEFYLMAPADRRRANVVLHVVSEDVSELVSDPALESPLLLAADLAEHPGIRERNEAVRAMAAVQTHPFSERNRRPGPHHG